jgi:mannitol/fructose-specific phosphotransferase system IIA component (Ntr-type)
METKTLSEQLPPDVTGIPAPLSVAGSMNLSRIKLNLVAASKDAVLRELAALVVPPRRKRDIETLYKALKAREALCTTCVDDGVAIPHSRNAIVGLVKDPVIAYGRHPGLEFGALDGLPVRHFFLLCAPNVQQHLQLLGKLARMLRTTGFIAKLDATRTPEEVLELIRANER